MSGQTIHLGYEVGTGEPVSIPLRHMAVTGQSQEAGKTTTLEALIDRSGCRAIAFVTKRGEGAFSSGRRVPPYFRERADWVFVASLIDATLREKNKMLRSFLMKVCRTTKTLAEVRSNVKAALRTAKGFAESIYTEIDGYLDLVVPQLQQLPPHSSIEIKSGLNVMDLTDYSTELQGLVIRSVLEHVYQREQDLITVIPEAWEFLPQGRGSPVKLAFEELIRKGAVLRNYVWIDSQDMGGVEKLALRAAAVWLIGVQREANEIKRTLSNIPGGLKKPKSDDVATLERGRFYACHGTRVQKVYVQPAWMDAGDARRIAMGERVTVSPPVQSSRPGDRLDHPLMKWPPRFIEPTKEKEEESMSANAEKKLDTLIELMTRQMTAGVPVQAPSPAPAVAAMPTDEEAMYQRFKARLMKEAPAMLKVLAVEPSLKVEIEEQVVEVDGKTAYGQFALLVAEGFFDDASTGNSAFNELIRRGVKVAKPSVYDWAKKFAGMGLLTVEGDSGFKTVPGVKRNIKKK